MSAMSEPGRQATLTEGWEAAESAERQAPAEDGPDTLPCGHDAAWLESGACMACEPAWMTADEREARDELELTRQPGGYE